MKPSLLTILASLLTLATAKARNPEPLRISGQETAPNPAARGRVVLVHGFLEKGLAFSFMKRRLEKLGFDCLVPQMRPSDGRGGLELLAEGLKRDIESAYGPDESILLVGFSMGGVVSRYYLQELGGASRCEKFVTISSPHNGTHAAWLYPTKGAEQMRPGSPFLTNLERSAVNLGDMPVVSYHTPLDLIILPARSSVWNRAENIDFPVLLHPLMLTSRKVLADLEKRLLP